jgi:hypothetical protein
MYDGERSEQSSPEKFDVAHKRRFNVGVLARVYE